MIRRIIRSECGSFWIVFAVCLGFYWLTRFGPTPYNAPVAQAQAFLHGHSWIEDQPGPYETIVWQGHSYFPYPLLPALMMVPLVAIQGMSVNQLVVSLVVGALDVALAWRLLGKLGLSTSPRIWLTLFFGAGTTIWYEATWGASWDFTLILAALPTLAALCELFGKGRAWEVGIFAGLAALGRSELVFVWPVYAVVLWLRGRRLLEILNLAWGWGLAFGIYVLFNESRFGTVFDRALWIWFQQSPSGVKSNPGINVPYSWHFIPGNLYTVLFMAPGINATFPYIHPQMMGQALLLTSPAFVLALRPSIRKPVTLALWVAALLPCIPVLIWYWNGTSQFGARYYVEIFPFLLVLMALGIENQMADQLTKALILASIVLVSFGVWHIHMWGLG
jgi:hypothetical protein